MIRLLEILQRGMSHGIRLAAYIETPVFIENLFKVFFSFWGQACENRTQAGGNILWVCLFRVLDCLRRINTPGSKRWKWRPPAFFFRLSQCSVGRSGIGNADFINSFISFVVAETLVRNWVFGMFTDQSPSSKLKEISLKCCLETIVFPIIAGYSNNW